MHAVGAVSERSVWRIVPSVFCRDGVCSQPSEDAGWAQLPPAGGSGAADVLRGHFLSEAYDAGADLDEFEAQDGGYVLEATEGRVPVYRHEETGVRSWRQALRLALPGEADVEVVFHYTTAEGFHEVATAPCITPEIWANMRREGLEGGLAVYVARREPAELVRQGSPWASDRDHCIPLLVPAAEACNADFPEDRCVAGSSPRRGRDLWILRLCDGALTTATLDIEHRFRRLLRTSEAELGPEHRETLDAAGYLAYLLDAAGKSQEAEPLYRRALAGYEASGSGEASRSASNLAALLSATGRRAEAEPLARRAASGLEALLGPNHPDVIASLGNLAFLCEPQEAEALLRRVMTWREIHLGLAHPEASAAAADLAACLASQGRHGEAVALGRRVLRQREALGQETLGSLAFLAAELEALGAWQESEEASKALLERAPESEEAFAALRRLAALARRRGDRKAAEPLCRRACGLGERLFGADPRVQQCRADLAALLVEDLPACDVPEAPAPGRALRCLGAIASLCSEARQCSQVRPPEGCFGFPCHRAHGPDEHRLCGMGAREGKAGVLQGATRQRSDGGLLAVSGPGTSLVTIV